MEPIVDAGDFPASRQSAYLNTASVSLMYKGAQTTVVQWMQDLADYGTIHFDEAAEEDVFTRRPRVSSAGVLTTLQSARAPPN